MEKQFQHEVNAPERHPEFVGQKIGTAVCRNQFLDEFLDEWTSEIHQNEVNAFLSHKGFPSLPSFSGLNPEDWINGCEEYFDVYQSMETYQFSLVADLLVGRAKEWFASWSFSGNKENYWDEFADALCERFEDDEGNIVELVGCELSEKQHEINDEKADVDEINDQEAEVDGVFLVEPKVHNIVECFHKMEEELNKESNSEMMVMLEVESILEDVSVLQKVNDDHTVESKEADLETSSLQVVEVDNSCQIGTFKIKGVNSAGLKKNLINDMVIQDEVLDVVNKERLEPCNFGLESQVGQLWFSGSILERDAYSELFDKKELDVEKMNLEEEPSGTQSWNEIEAWTNEIADSKLPPVVKQNAIDGISFYLAELFWEFWPRWQSEERFEGRWKAQLVDGRTSAGVRVNSGDSYGDLIRDTDLTKLQNEMLGKMISAAVRQFTWVFNFKVMQTVFLSWICNIFDNQQEVDVHQEFKFSYLSIWFQEFHSDGISVDLFIGEANWTDYFGKRSTKFSQLRMVKKFVRKFEKLKATFYFGLAASMQLKMSHWILRTMVSDTSSRVVVPLILVVLYRKDCCKCESLCQNEAREFNGILVGMTSSFLERLYQFSSLQLSIELKQQYGFWKAAQICKCALMQLQQPCLIFVLFDAHMLFRFHICYDLNLADRVLPKPGSCYDHQLKIIKLDELITAMVDWLLLQNVEKCAKLKVIVLKKINWNDAHVFGKEVDQWPTHSFIDGVVAQNISLQTEAIPALVVTVANGERIVSKKLCKGFQWEKGEHKFASDLIILNHGEYDVVLGANWMKFEQPGTSLEFDFLEIQAEFKKDGKSIVWKSMSKDELLQFQLNSGSGGSIPEVELTAMSCHELFSSVFMKKEDVMEGVYLVQGQKEAVGLLISADSMSVIFTDAGSSSAAFLQRQKKSIDLLISANSMSVSFTDAASSCPRAWQQLWEGQPLPCYAVTGLQLYTVVALQVIAATTLQLIITTSLPSPIGFPTSTEQWNAIMHRHCCFAFDIP